VAALLFGAAACGDDHETDADGGSTGSGAPEPPPASPKALVKLKSAPRFRFDLARSLDVEPGEVCTELGLYDCMIAHQVVMGSADPYVSQLYEPLPTTSATSPLAYERFATSACVKRVDADLGSPSAVIFASLPLAGGGLADMAAPEVGAALRTLYRRGLSRDATDAEVAGLIGMYDAIAAADTSGEPARSWAIASCVAVLTSLENVFY
jgi:hypothetical protein